MVIHGEDPGRPVMARSQVGVAPVELVTRPVGGKVHALGQCDWPGLTVGTVFVDVVAHEHHEVDVLGGNPGMGGVVAVGPVLTTGDGETGLGGQCASAREGPGAAHRTRPAIRREAVPKFGIRLKARHIDVHRVGQSRHCRSGTGGHHGGERIVGGHLPIHRNVGGRQGIAGVGRQQAGPENDAARGGVARRNAEREQLTNGQRRCSLAGRRHAPRVHHGQPRGGQGAGQERAPAGASPVLAADRGCVSHARLGHGLLPHIGDPCVECRAWFGSAEPISGLTAGSFLTDGSQHGTPTTQGAQASSAGASQRASALGPRP